MADSTIGAATTLPPLDSPPLRRRNTIATYMSTLELVSLNPPFSYTSLRDMLPSPNAAINSPTATASAYEISIRNRLVKQAAWAYLQPMSSASRSSSSSSTSATATASACFSFLYHHLITGCARFLRLILHALRGLVRT